MNIDIISQAFLKYACEMGNLYESLPLGTKENDFGAPYIEISGSGNLAIVARDRGHECLRKETKSPDILAKWIYEAFNK